MYLQNIDLHLATLFLGDSWHYKRTRIAPLYQASVRYDAMKCLVRPFPRVSTFWREGGNCFDNSCRTPPSTTSFSSCRNSLSLQFSYINKHQHLLHIRYPVLHTQSPQTNNYTPSNHARRYDYPLRPQRPRRRPDAHRTRRHWQHHRVGRLFSSLFRLRCH